MHTDLKLHIAILNCYPKTSRARFDAADVGHPHNLYRDFLRRYVPLASVDLIFIADPDVALPAGANLASYDGYIWTGSDLTIYHVDDERVTRQIELARAIFEAGVPSYGSCWGVQLAAFAAGGEVRKNPRGREWSIARRIQRTEAGKQSPLLRGKPDVYDGFIMHLDEVVTLPPGATLLATNEHTPVQAIEVKHRNGTFWATQYHPEYNFFEMARLIRARAEPLVKEGFFATVDDVQVYADAMFRLAAQPDDPALRQQFSVGPDIVSADIRETELRNWIDHLVLPSRRA
ncbi:MAG: type 1 glutamine amidotransferase, partial [Anaerolineae bacterium]|nr:type 1 glutamine amidotransferase [Anaerolineae bacterium]